MADTLPKIPIDLKPVVNLGGLPLPLSVEGSRDFDTIYPELLAQHNEIDPQYGLLVENDPGALLLQLFAYQKMVLIRRQDAVGRSTLLAFATGATLDHKVAEQGVTRLEGETDERLRERYLHKVRGGNPGTTDYYAYWAKTASLLVKQVAVWSPSHADGYNMGGQVVLTVLADYGIPSVELLQHVAAVINRKDIQLANDFVTVEPPAYRRFNVKALITLKPDTPFELFDALRLKVRQLIEAKSLGDDVTHSWLVTQLHVEGVHSIRLLQPAKDITCRPHEFVQLDRLDIVFAGFSGGENRDASSVPLSYLARMAHQYYLQYAVKVHRSIEGVLSDLSRSPIAGVIEPTLEGMADYLGITEHRNPTSGELLPSDEIAALVQYVLSQSYK